MTIELIVNPDPSFEELQGIAEACRRAGMSPTSMLTQCAGHIGGEPPWEVIVLVGFPLAQFFGGFFSEAGKDGWQRLKTWVEDIGAARRTSRDRAGTITVKDSGGTEVLLPSIPLADKAFRQLVAIDWNDERGRRFSWNASSHQWERTMVLAVVLDPTDSADVLSAVCEAFKRVRLAPLGRYANTAASSEGELPGAVFVHLGCTAEQFFQSFRRMDWKALQSWAEEIRHARRTARIPDSSIVIRDDIGTEVILPGPSLPNIAYQRLQDLDWRLGHGGRLTWNGRQARWERF